MTKLENLKREIESLQPEDMRALAKWFADLRVKLWDQHLEAESPALDALAEQALEDHKTGKATPLVRR